MSAYNPFGTQSGSTVINTGATSIAGLKDVNIGTPQLNDVLTYDGTTWISGVGNNAPSNALIATAPLTATDNLIIVKDGGGSDRITKTSTTDITVLLQRIDDLEAKLTNLSYNSTTNQTEVTGTIKFI